MLGFVKLDGSSGLSLDWVLSEDDGGEFPTTSSFLQIPERTFPRKFTYSGLGLTMPMYCT